MDRLLVRRSSKPKTKARSRKYKNELPPNSRKIDINWTTTLA
jgi:hypothetical protein